PAAASVASRYLWRTGRTWPAAQTSPSSAGAGPTARPQVGQRSRSTISGGKLIGGWGRSSSLPRGGGAPGLGWAGAGARRLLVYIIGPGSSARRSEERR